MIYVRSLLLPFSLLPFPTPAGFPLPLLSPSPLFCVRALSLQLQWQRRIDASNNSEHTHSIYGLAIHHTLSDPHIISNSPILVLFAKVLPHL